MRPVALVTGASAGIGKTFAHRLAGLGFELILVARRADRLSEVARELGVEVPGLDVRCVAADLASEEGVRAVEAEILGCDRLEMLVNNAGFGTLGRFWETDLEGQVAMHRLHVMAVLRLTRAALAGMTARGRGAVINVSSVAAFGQSEGNVSYCATKAWMNSFTLGLDVELRAVGSPVKVQALCPGFTVTEFHDTLGIDRGQIPSWLWMSADSIVEASLRGLEKNRAIVVPGWKYKLGVAVLKALPHALARRMKRPGKDRRV